MLHFDRSKLVDKSLDLKLLWLEIIPEYPSRPSKKFKGANTLKFQFFLSGRLITEREVSAVSSF